MKGLKKAKVCATKEVATFHNIDSFYRYFLYRSSSDPIINYLDKLFLHCI